MALYYFILKHDWDSYPDTEGVECESELEAQEQAIATARELMRHRELDTRFWRIEIRDQNLQLRSEVYFSTVDSTIDHLPSELRQSIDSITQKNAGLVEAILQIRASIVEAKSTLSRADRFLKLMRRENNQ